MKKRTLVQAKGKLVPAKEAIPPPLSKTTVPPAPPPPAKSSILQPISKTTVPPAPPPPAKSSILQPTSKTTVPPEPPPPTQNLSPQQLVPPPLSQELTQFRQRKGQKLNQFVDDDAYLSEDEFFSDDEDDEDDFLTNVEPNNANDSMQDDLFTNVETKTANDFMDLVNNSAQNMEQSNILLQSRMLKKENKTMKTKTKKSAVFSIEKDNADLQNIALSRKGKKKLPVPDLPPPQKIKPRVEITTDMLQHGMKKLKSIEVRTLETVKITPVAVLNLFEKRDYFPLLNFINTITLNAFGKCELIQDLSLVGIEQVTDLLFYNLMSHMVDLPNLEAINVSGCYHLTDAGMKYCALQFPYINTLYAKGCEKITERTLFYFLDSPFSVVEHIDLTSTNVRAVSGKFKKQLGVFGIKGCPMITPSTEVLNVKGRGALLGDEPLVDLKTYKVVVLNDQPHTHSFVDIITKKSVPGLYMKIHENFQSDHSDYKFNIYEVRTGMGLEDLVLSNGGIVVLTYTSVEPDTVDKLTKQLIYLLVKYPENAFVIADMTASGGDSSSIAQGVVESLALWCEKFGSDHTLPISDLVEEFSFSQQQNFVKALLLSDAVSLIQANPDLVLGVDMSGEKCNTPQFLEESVSSLREHFQWHANIFHPQSAEYINKSYAKKNVRLGSLTDLINVSPDALKFNINSKTEPYRELDKMFEYRHERGISVYFPKMPGKPGFLDLSAIKDFCNKIGDKLPKPTQKASVVGLGKDFPCFTRQDLCDTLSGTQEENDMFIKILVENKTLLKLPLSQKHPSIKDATVYVSRQHLPQSPHVPLEHFWDGKLDDTLYSGKKYRIPVLPDNLLVSIARNFVKVAKISLIWKKGMILQQGPITYMIEIFSNGENPGVLLDGKLHSKAKPGEEQYLESDRLVWRGLRGIAAVFEDTMFNDGVYFSGEYFFCGEKRFNRKEALDWFAGVPEKPHMCDSIQKLVPNHEAVKALRGTKCYQCGNCSAKSIDCTDNLSNYQYSIECGCREYVPLCDNCGMCATCVHTISKAVSTIQPSFRMMRDTEKDKLNVAGSYLSFGMGGGLEYSIRSNMCYETFSHLKAVMLRGITFVIDMANFSDGTAVEILRYHTNEGKIEVLKTSKEGEEVKDTIKQRKFACYTGYKLEFCLTNPNTFELCQNGQLLHTWELTGPSVRLSIKAIDPGCMILSSNSYVDFQDITTVPEDKCCELSLPSCVERKLTSVFFRASNLLFGESKDFSGAAGCILPQSLSDVQLQYPTPQVLYGNRIVMPLCLTKNRFTEDWNLAKLLHIVNSPGFPVKDTDISSIAPIGMACNSVLSHYPNINIPDNMEKYLPGIKGKLGVTEIERGLQDVIRLIGMDLILEMGLSFDLKSQLPSHLRRLFENVMQTFMEDSEKSGLHAAESVLVSEKILYLCEGHKSAYQSRSDITELIPLEFKGYGQFIRDIKFVKSALVSIHEDVFRSMPLLIRVELYENLLEKVPESIGTCKFLQFLDVADNNLTDLPQTLSNCTELNRLDIGRNIMESVPSVVPKLKLKRLLLNNMLLTSLPENIGDMEQLEMLYAAGNCFTKLPKSMSKLKNLQDLSLGGVMWIENKESTFYTRQQFEDFLLTTRIGHWLDAHHEDKEKLFHQFDLDSNNVLDTKEIGNVNATLFNIFPRFGYKGQNPPDDDDPSGFPEELLELTSLTYLNLQNQGIVHVPEGIGKLSKLETLVLSNNPNLLSVAGQCGMLPLKRLELSNCGLLKTPPKEIRERGFNTVYAYLRRLMTGSVECKRTKLMFVGLGGAGKTSLAKALMTNEFQTSLTGAQAITDGIDICTWTVNHDGEHVQYSVWDFAGQTVYYNTHQFFLSDRAVYLLLWNVRLGQEHAGLNFWLSSISVHASKAPIFIIGTHMDQVPKAELPTEEMMATYPQIEGFFFVSSFTGQGIEELRSNLLKVSLKQDYMGEKIPAAYLELENIILKKRKQNVNLVEYSEVEKMANNAGIVDKEEVAQAVQFLHDLGSVQHFSNEVLKSKVVINPQWIVDVMAKVVSVKESPVQEGKLKHSDLGKVWKDYPSNIHYWLLQLTEEYDLTFKLANENVNLVPCLLPEKKPEIPWPDLKKDSGIKETNMRYAFEYLPAGLFNRAQVRLQEFSDSSIIWKRGSFLRKNEHIALLHQNKDSEMVVKVQGPRPENVLFLVHEVFEALINESFNGVKYDFSVPCPDCNSLMKRDPHMFTASMIRRAIDLQAPFLQCLKYFHTISVGDLQSIMPPDTTKDYDIHLAHAVNDLQEFEKGKTLDIFISYCEVDAPKDKSNVIHPEDMYKELKKQDYRCFFPEVGKNVSMDTMAKSLIESSIFVACISNNYVNDAACCNLFKFAKSTLRKPFIIVAVGPDHEWKKSALGLLVSDVVFVNMIDSKKSVFDSKMQELLEKIKELYSVEVSKESPPCFISYCWKNSKEAVDLGTKSDPKSYAQTPDPRDIASFLTASGVPCWLDTKRIGFGMTGLLDDIAKGLLGSKLMISFVSDEYAASNNSMTELNFAALTLQIPIIMAVVGQGDDWKKSEVNLLAFKQHIPMVDFRHTSENEGKEKILSLAKGIVGEDSLKDTSEKGSMKKTPKEKDKNSDKKNSLSFQELYELAQRKFHHQIMQYASAQDTGLPYPRLFLIDILKEKDKKDEKSEEEKNLLDDLEISFRDGKYCVHTLCECETGWHTVAEPIVLEDFGMTELTHYTPYMSRITALMKHNTHFSMNAVSNKHGIAFLRFLAEASATELPECKTEYQELREMVISLDTERNVGGLSRCRLPSGKTIWLCQEHISKMKVTVLTNEMIAHDKTTTDAVGVDYMIESLRELDPVKMPLSFKSSKKAKRSRTAPKDDKEKENIEQRMQLRKKLSKQHYEMRSELKAKTAEMMTELNERTSSVSEPEKNVQAPNSNDSKTEEPVKNSTENSKPSVSSISTAETSVPSKTVQTKDQKEVKTPSQRPTSEEAKKPEMLAKSQRSKSKACSVM